MRLVVTEGEFLIFDLSNFQSVLIKNCIDTSPQIGWPAVVLCVVGVHIDRSRLEFGGNVPGVL